MGRQGALIGWGSLQGLRITMGEMRALHEGGARELRVVSHAGIVTPSILSAPRVLEGRHGDSASILTASGVLPKCDYAAERLVRSSGAIFVASIAAAET